MANKISIHLGHAASRQIPIAVYTGSVSAANLLGHYTAIFDINGNAVISAPPSMGELDDRVIVIGTDSTGGNSPNARAFEADVVITDDAGGGGGVGPSQGFAPLTNSYSRATFTPVTVPASEAIIFYVASFETDEFLQDLQFVVSGIDGDFINISRTNERFRVVYKATPELDVTFDLVGLVLDSGQHKIELRNNAAGTALECYIDGVFYSANPFGPQTPKPDMTFDTIGDYQDINSATQGAIYGVTLGTQAAWPMLATTSTGAYSGEDIIGNNDLTFVGAPGTITEANTIDINVFDGGANGGGAGGGATIIGFAPLTASYTEATFASVNVPAAEPIEFHIKGATTDQFQQDLQFVLSGASGDFMNISRTNQRFRLVYRSTPTTDITFDLVGLVLDGGEHKVTFKNNAGGTALECFVDDVLYTNNPFGPQTPKPDMTFDTLANNAPGTASMTQGAIYGVTLGTQAAWTMLAANATAPFNGADSIGTNDLTFVGAPGTVTSTNTVAVYDYVAPGVIATSGFAALISSYTSATFTPVTIPANEPIKFKIKDMFLDVSGSIYILSGTDDSHIRFNLNNGRLFFRDQTTPINANWDIPDALDGGEHSIEIRNNAGGTESELLLDGVIITPLTGNPRVTITFNMIGEDNGGGGVKAGAIYDVELGSQAAWSMLTNSATAPFNGADSIGTNNITFNGAPDPVTAADTVEIVGA